MFLHKNGLGIQFQSHRKLFQRVIYQVPYLHLTQLLLYPATVWSPKEGMAFCIQFQYFTWTFWTLLELYYVHKLPFGVMSSDVPGHVYKSALKETKINRLLSQTWSTLCSPSMQRSPVWSGVIDVVRIMVSFESGWSGALWVLCVVRKLWIRSLSWYVLVMSCALPDPCKGNILIARHIQIEKSAWRTRSFLGTFQTLQSQQPCNVSPVRWRRCQALSCFFLLLSCGPVHAARKMHFMDGVLDCLLPQTTYVPKTIFQKDWLKNLICIVLLHSIWQVRYIITYKYKCARWFLIAEHLVTFCPNSLDTWTNS